jgi:hypothetical protein
VDRTNSIRDSQLLSDPAERSAKPADRFKDAIQHDCW